MKDIPYESWRAEIEKAMFTAGDEGMSAREIAKTLGLSVKTTLDRIRELHSQGRIISGKKRSTCVDGRSSWVPVYRLKEKK